MKRDQRNLIIAVARKIKAANPGLSYAGVAQRLWETTGHQVCGATVHYWFHKKIGVEVEENGKKS
jgi:hypothetical protein